MSMRRSERKAYGPEATKPISRRGPVRALLPILLILSIVLMALSRIDHPAVREIRWRIAEIMTPVLSTLMVPLEPLRWVGQHIPDFLTMGRELDALRDENQRLKGWEWRAHELERKIEELSSLEHVVRDPALDFVTVRVVANSSGAFVRSAMVNGGTEQRLKAGYPVLSGDGLVGRVVETGATAARVLFLTDFNSRIPVIAGSNAVRAVLIGDNGPSPRLDYLAPDSGLKAGDEVSTSGIGGLYPRGLRIGTVIETPRGLRVKPHANLDRVEYLSVLFYESPQLDFAATPGRDGSAKGLAAGEGNPPLPLSGKVER